MPILEISDGEGNLLPMATLSIASRMLFPNDDFKCRHLEVMSIAQVCGNLARNLFHNQVVLRNTRYLRSMGIEKPYTAIKEISHKAYTDTVLESFQPYGGILSILDLALSEPITARETDARWKNGFVAGLLITMFTHLHAANRQASMNKAVFLVEKTLESPDNADWANSKTDRSIWKNWKEYKSVAHLWGAVCIWIMCFGYEQRASWLNDHNSLLIFLRFAIWLEQKGQSLSTRIQGKQSPLLDSDSLWLIPSDLGIEPYEMGFVDNGWTEDMLNEYRAPKKI
jgi:hypothetical protein